jgi:hypothetical protein
MSETTRATERRQDFRCFLSSVVVWILVFASVCSCVAILFPSRSLNAADGVESRFRMIVEKLNPFLNSPEQADIVMLGSSLILVPAVRCDDKMNGKECRFDREFFSHYIIEYSQASYLEKQLKLRFGDDIKVKNLGIAASIMSDHCGIFKMMLAEEKHPRLLILALAPRDFLDNTYKEHLKTPTRMFIREFEDPSFVPASFSSLHFLDAVTNIEHRFGKVIAKLRTSSIEIACAVTGHVASVDHYRPPAVPHDERANELNDLETYRRLYNPPNFKMLASQSEYLREFLVAAKANNIPVLVVNMPVTKENIATLDPVARSIYTSRLKSLTTEFNTPFLDVGTDTDKLYQKTDFEDCCHLNTAGGEKFFGALVDYLGSRSSLVKKI